MVKTLGQRNIKVNDTVSTLFVDYPCPIRHGHLGRTKQEDKVIIDYFKKYKADNPDYEPSNLSGWRTTWNAHIDHEQILSGLMMDILQWHNTNVSHPRNDYVPDFIKQKQDFDLDAEVWYTEYDKGDYADEHHHGTVSRTSFVYYLDCEDDGSPLTFVKKATPMYGAFPKTVELFNLNTYPGMIVFFPSFLHHRVDPTRSKRYVLAGNINDIIYKTPDA